MNTTHRKTYIRTQKAQAAHSVENEMPAIEKSKKKLSKLISKNWDSRKTRIALGILGGAVVVAGIGFALTQTQIASNLSKGMAGVGGKLGTQLKDLAAENKTLLTDLKKQIARIDVKELLSKVA